MKHRLQHHEEEDPECNSIKEGKPCLKKTRCWFRHPKPTGNVLLQNVPAQTVRFPENFNTPSNNGLDFWPTLPTSKPPNQMEQMMEMLKVVMTEVSGLKKKINQN